MFALNAGLDVLFFRGISINLPFEHLKFGLQPPDHDLCDVASVQLVGNRRPDDKRKTGHSPTVERLPGLHMAIVRDDNRKRRLGITSPLMVYRPFRQAGLAFQRAWRLPVLGFGRQFADPDWQRMPQLPRRAFSQALSPIAGWPISEWSGCMAAVPEPLRYG